MKLTEAWSRAEQLAQVSRRDVKIVKVSDKLRKLRGEQFAFTLEQFPIEGEIVGVVKFSK